MPDCITMATASRPLCLLATCTKAGRRKPQCSLKCLFPTNYQLIWANSDCVSMTCCQSLHVKQCNRQTAVAAGMACIYRHFGGRPLFISFRLQVLTSKSTKHAANDYQAPIKSVGIAPGFVSTARRGYTPKKQLCLLQLSTRTPNVPY